MSGNVLLLNIAAQPVLCPVYKQWYAHRKKDFSKYVLKKFSNNIGTTHHDSLQGSYWVDQKDSHNEVIMTSLQGQ